jgi:hypothetical protein
MGRRVTLRVSVAGVLARGVSAPEGHHDGVEWRFDKQAVGDAITDMLRPKGPPRRVEVPNVVGQPITTARLALTRIGLRVKVRRDRADPPAVEGLVVDQDPPPGTRLRRYRRVTLLLTFPANSPT